MVTIFCYKSDLWKICKQLKNSATKITNEETPGVLINRMTINDLKLQWGRCFYKKTTYMGIISFNNENSHLWRKTLIKHSIREKKEGGGISSFSTNHPCEFLYILRALRHHIFIEIYIFTQREFRKISD